MPPLRRVHIVSSSERPRTVRITDADTGEVLTTPENTITDLSITATAEGILYASITIRRQVASLDVIAAADVEDA